MTFEGQYLTKQEYIALGGSSTIEDMPFNLLEFKARRLIDIRTMNRLVNGENIPQNVKLCDNDLINSIIKDNEELNKISENGNKASENTNGYSVSYITADQVDKVIETNKNKYNSIIEENLTFVSYKGEHLLYIGL